MRLHPVLGEVIVYFATVRMPSVLAVAILLMSLVGLRLEIADLEAERDRWDKTTKETYARAFPNATRLDDVGRLVRQQLAQVRSAGEGDDTPTALMFLDSMARARAASNTVTLTRFAFRRGVIEAELNAGSLADFDAWIRVVERVKRRVERSKRSMLLRRRAARSPPSGMSRG